MLDSSLHPLSRAICARIALPLHQAGVTAARMSIAGFAIGLAAVPALAFQAYGLALGLILLNRLADGLDGALARLEGPTARGAFLDATLDFIFYAAIPAGFALADPAANGLPAAVLLASFMGTGASFLALAAAAARKGLENPDFPKKGIYYVGGITEGAETIAFFVLCCLWPAAFPPVALVFAGLCGITAALRLRWGWQILT